MHERSEWEEVGKTEKKTKLAGQPQFTVQLIH